MARSGPVAAGGKGVAAVRRADATRARITVSVPLPRPSASLRRRGGRSGAEAILAGFSRPVQALSERLREVVRAAVPVASETGYPVWRGIGYRTEELGYFCGIFPQRDCVKLGFEHGRSLPDPEGLLTGTGRQVRYVVLRSRREIRVAALKRLLRAAAAPGAGH